MQALYALLRQTPKPWQYATLKRIIDILGSIVALIPVLIISIPVAIGLTLTQKGSLLFTQARGGKSGNSFTIYKFRTMDIETGESGKFAAFLRKTAIDELLQLFNVLKGDMSLIGPRPHMTEHDKVFAREVDNYALRQTVKPGMTGWAQAHGYTGPIEEPQMLRNRIQKDLEYAENASLWLDIKIIFMTLTLILRRAVS